MITGLDALINEELVGVTFIRDYIQFIFEDSILNTYTIPHIIKPASILTESDMGFCDNLRLLIGNKVLSVYEDEKEKNIKIKFETDIEIRVSLKLEDRQCAEAITLQTPNNFNLW
jgi:hypothetical protein